MGVPGVGVEITAMTGKVAEVQTQEVVRQVLDYVMAPNSNKAKAPDRDVGLGWEFFFAFPDADKPRPRKREFDDRQPYGHDAVWMPTIAQIQAGDHQDIVERMTQLTTPQYPWKKFNAENDHRIAADFLLF